MELPVDKYVSSALLSCQNTQQKLSGRYDAYKRISLHSYLEHFYLLACQLSYLHLHLVFKIHLFCFQKKEPHRAPYSRSLTPWQAQCASSVCMSPAATQPQQNSSTMAKSVFILSCLLACSPLVVVDCAFPNRKQS